MTQTPDIRYAREASLDAEEFRRVLAESGLARPIDDIGRLRAMLAASDLIVTARRGPGAPLVGIARSVTDFAWCCYLSDLAVSASAQGQGVGRGLLEETRRQVGPAVSVILASVPTAVGFYERAGMARVPDAFWYRRAH